MEASGAGPAEIETVEAGDGSCDVRFEARVAGRYTLYVWSGYKRDPVKGAPIEVRVSPGQAAAAHCVATVEGAHDDQGFISSNTNSGITPNVGQINARAGDLLTIKMHARDRFGNATVWKEWQTLEVRASGPRDVRFEEIQTNSSAGGGSQIRGQFRSMFSKAGSYVVWVTVGGQTVVGWPRVIHASPNVTDADQSKMRPEAETLALMSELVTSNHRGNRMLLGAPVRDRGAFGQRTLAGAMISEDEDNADQLRRETEALKIKLAEYERAAAVVAMAAQKGVEAELKQQQQQDVVVSKVVKGGGKQQRQLRDIESETEEEE